MKVIYSDRSLRYNNTRNYYAGSFYTSNTNPTQHIDCMDGYVCWGKIVKSLDDTPSNIHQTINLKIKIYKCKSNLDNNTCEFTPFCGKHGCFFSYNELCKFFELFKEYHPFSYALTGERDHYLLSLSMTGNKNQILWILNLIRHTYEFPFNVFLKDSYKLLKYYPGEHIVNLIQVVASAGYECNYCVDQSLGGLYRKLVDIQTIKSNLCDMYLVSDIYRNVYKCNDGLFLRLTEDKDISIDSYAYWLNTDLFHNFFWRRFVYRRIYRLLK